jgi:hypothetical protein
MLQAEKKNFVPVPPPVITATRPSTLKRASILKDMTAIHVMRNVREKEIALLVVDGSGLIRTVATTCDKRVSGTEN